MQTDQIKPSERLYRCNLHEIEFQTFEELQLHLSNSSVHRDLKFRDYRISELVNYARELPSWQVYDAVIKEAKLRWLLSDVLSVEYAHDVIRILKAQRARA